MHLRIVALCCLQKMHHFILYRLFPIVVVIMAIGQRRLLSWYMLNPSDSTELEVETNRVKDKEVMCIPDLSKNWLANPPCTPINEFPTYHSSLTESNPFIILPLDAEGNSLGDPLTFAEIESIMTHGLQNKSIVRKDTFRHTQTFSVFDAYQIPLSEISAAFQSRGISFQGLQIQFIYTIEIPSFSSSPRRRRLVDFHPPRVSKDFRLIVTAPTEVCTKQAPQPFQPFDAEVCPWLESK
jgi:hypothetical protein